MRLIDGDKLKKEVLKWLPSDPCGVEEKEIPFETDIVVSVLMEIEEAPTIELKWIPCSERLPEENGDYLVTLENGVVTERGYSTTQRTTYPKGFYYIDGAFSWRQIQNPVVAWMPLPEPWEGVDNE